MKELLEMLNKIQAELDDLNMHGDIPTDSYKYLSSLIDAAKEKANI